MPTEVKGFEAGTNAWSIILFYVKQSPKQQKILQEYLPKTCVCNCRVKFGLHIWTHAGDLHETIDLLKKVGLGDYMVEWKQVVENEGRPNGPWLVSTFGEDEPKEELEGLDLDKDGFHLSK